MHYRIVNVVDLRPDYAAGLAGTFRPLSSLIATFGYRRSRHGTWLEHRKRMPVHKTQFNSAQMTRLRLQAGSEEDAQRRLANIQHVIRASPSHVVASRTRAP